eukprot:evm.model.scf_792.5 EVM.evm.TU.scf_792.5   scf_792:37970-38967(-)
MEDQTLDAYNTMRHLLIPRGNLTAEGIAGFICAFLVFGFFFCALVAFTCTLSGNISRLEERVTRLEKSHAHEEDEQGKLL